MQVWRHFMGAPGRAHLLEGEILHSPDKGKS